MKKTLLTVVALTIAAMGVPAEMHSAPILNTTGSWSDTPPPLGPSWDNPPSTVVSLLAGQTDEYNTDASGNPAGFGLTAGTYTASLLFERAAFAPYNILFRSPVSNPGNRSIIFTGLHAPGSAEVSFTTEEDWLLWLWTPQGNLFGSMGENFLALRSSLDSANVFIGIEDLRLPGDRDYNDMVLSLTKKMDPTTPIPEPGTITLFGLGAVGLAFARRRKKQ